MERKCSDPDRLAAFERLYADLLNEQQAVLEELDRLRTAGKEKTVRFRELLGQKLLLSAEAARFKRYGL